MNSYSLHTERKGFLTTRRLSRTSWYVDLESLRTQCQLTRGRFQHNATGTICWTIHRPLRGWYIRIRSPMFPPGVFIPLTPVPSTAPYHAEGALSFKSQTNIAITSASRASESGRESTSSTRDESASSSIHSYPPTPTGAVINVQPPSPLPSSPADRPSPPQLKISNRRPQSQITQFILAPSSIPPTHQQPVNTSIFARALSVLKNHRPSHSNSFTLSRVLPPKMSATSGTATPPPPYASNASLTNEIVQPIAAAVQTALQQQESEPLLQAPLLVFHDRTPVLMVRSLTGMIEVDESEERALGVETSFWIAVALTYLEFLEEREVTTIATIKSYSPLITY